MPGHTCPPWIGYLMISPLRRLFDGSAAKLLAPYVRPGMTVLEPGPAMGYFTLELARLVGPKGRVVAVDVQEYMLARLRDRAARAGVADRIETRLVAHETMALDDLAGTVDFVLAYAMVHETPDKSQFFAEVAATMKPGATVLLAEPRGHVNDERFAGELEKAAGAGLTVVERPRVRMSHAAVLRKEAEGSAT